MTIEALRERKRELLARKKEELALQERGEGDNLALFMVNEELLDVNAKLRALAPARPRRGGRASGQDWSLDRQQYLEWLQADREEGDPRRDALRSALRDGRTLTERQRQVLALRQSGLNVVETAKQLGVNPSTVSRTLKRAEARVRMDGERRVLTPENGRADLSSRKLCDLVLRTLTPAQTFYIYLYYSEWMNICEISALTGVCPSTVSRTLRRGMNRLYQLFDGQARELHNAEALDDALFAIYSQIRDETLTPSRQHKPREEALPRARREEPPAPQLRVFSRQRERPVNLRVPAQVLQSERGFRAVLRTLLQKRSVSHVFDFLKLWFRQQRKSIKGGTL